MAGEVAVMLCSGRDFVSPSGSTDSWEDRMLPWIVITTVPSICSLAALWLMLRFFWRVYRAGGADDLKAAAAAVRRVRTPISIPSLPRRSTAAGESPSRSAVGSHTDYDRCENE
ncbi:MULTISPECIES: hypothetical protein [Nocardia]|uniref:hypothetical protein n=1 Tax=Nocardia TaxID=1817 RepID=UPI00237E0BA7|nr:MULTISPECIES: hypothetical protein [Nocardia]MDE1670511.1 hypothetical protein [Nocardia gipuzkoensis]